jgi:hypothetical protein
MASGLTTSDCYMSEEELGRTPPTRGLPGIPLPRLPVSEAGIREGLASRPQEAGASLAHGYRMARIRGGTDRLIAA